MTTRTQQQIETGSIEGYQAKFIDVDGIRTRYYEVGEGNDETLVLVHGDLFAAHTNANTFTPTFPYLSKAVHVCAADKLASGLTDNPKSLEEYTQRAVTKHMFGFIEAKGIKQFHVMGQSNGAYPAARLALEHPDMCKSLIIGDSATLGPPVGDTQERRRKLFENLPDDPRGNYRARVERLNNFSWVPSDEFLDAAMFMGNTPKAKQTQEDLKSAGSAADAPGSAPDKAETLQWIEDGGLTMPVLITWGYNDPSAILPIGHQLFDMICKNTARAQMHIFNRFGHHHWRAAPEEWSSVVTTFIKHCE